MSICVCVYIYILYINCRNIVFCCRMVLGLLELGVLMGGGSHNKDYSGWGSILPCPYSGKGFLYVYIYIYATPPPKTYV